MDISFASIVTEYADFDGLMLSILEKFADDVHVAVDSTTRFKPAITRLSSDNLKIDLHLPCSGTTDIAVMARTVNITQTDNPCHLIDVALVIDVNEAIYNLVKPLIEDLFNSYQSAVNQPGITYQRKIAHIVIYKFSMPS